MGDDSMYYRMMGNTGIQVSVLSYGFWATYGVKDRLTGDAGVKSAKELMRIAREAGSIVSIMQRLTVIQMERLREYLVWR